MFRDIQRHYNEFCRCIECRYKEGWLHKRIPTIYRIDGQIIYFLECWHFSQELIYVQGRLNQSAHPRSLIRGCASSLSAWRNFASIAILNAPSENIDQTARTRRLIWIFTVHKILKVRLRRCSSAKNIMISAKIRKWKLSGFMYYF